MATVALTNWVYGSEVITAYDHGVALTLLAIVSLAFSR